jgi:dolichol-phosphate mannosyltransferase
MEHTDNQKRSLTILVPVYNEQTTIRPFLDELYAKGLKGITDFEVLMLEDGSKDKTVEVLRECEKSYPNLTAYTDPNRIGYAACVTRGIARASKDWILLMDGDGQIEPEDISLLLKTPTDYDIVCGEKFPRCDPWFRIVVSRFFDVCTDIVLGICLRDINFGFKLMRASAAKKLAPQCGKLGEIYTAELVIRFIYAGYRLCEVRTRHRSRLKGTKSQGIPPGKIIGKSWRAFRGLMGLRKELTAVAT